MFCEKPSIAAFMISICLAATTSTACASDGDLEYSGRTAYFAHMAFRESPFADPLGVYPISEEKARRYKHYRFVFDEFDRPVEISFRFGDVLQDLNISRNALTFTPLMRITYSEEKETRVFFDRFMNPTTSNGVFREEYDLDEDGNRIALRFYDADDQPVSSDWGVFRYEWAIDRRGTVTETRVDAAGEPVSIRPGFPFYCLKLHYDQRGLLAMMENYGKTCTELTQNELNAAQDKLQFNARGGAYAWNVYDANERRSVGNGPMVARGIMERNDLGHTTREYYEDTVGEIMTNAYGWTNSIAKFDEYGNMSERFNHDANGERIENPLLGYSGYVFGYSEDGERRISLSYFDAAGGPATHARRGYHSVETTYDDDGRTHRLLFKNAAGKLVNRKDYCAAIFEYAYDASNRRSSFRLFDADGDPVQHCSEGWHETEYVYHARGALLRTERNPL